MKRPVYQQMASSIEAHRNCLRNVATQPHLQEWIAKHKATAEAYAKDFLPDASLDVDKSTGEKLVFYTSYHHMNEDGYWDGYTDHTVIVTPSLLFGLAIRITGRDRNDVKEFLHQEWDTMLREEVEAR